MSETSGFPLSLELLLDRRLLQPPNRARIQQALSAGRLVVLRDALDTVFADRVLEGLALSDTWRQYEGASDDFHFRHHNLVDPSAYPPALAECRLFFESDDTKALMGDLSGRDCSAQVTFSASWYMPGDFSLPHDDCTSSGPERRQVAFLWHLTKDWDSRWGGHLYWGPSQQMVPPSFNSLILFAVSPRVVHFVAPVAANAGGRRIAVSGWWNGHDEYPASPDAPDDVVVLKP